jgi:iron(III) transport system ATP-binding protein
VDAPVLRLEGVAVEHQGTTVLEEVSVTIAAGEILTVAGPSGAGKTTLARVVLGFQRPSRGVVELGGRRLSRGDRLDVPPEERGLAAVFQDLALWPHLTVAAHLRFVLGARGVARAEHEPRVRATLEQVDLAALADRHPDQLSGGERQRVALARALVVRPQLLVLDEPFANLDVALKADLLHLLRELLRAERLAALFVTHAPDEVAALATRVAVLERGRLSQVGTIAELRSTPQGAFAHTLVSLLPPEPR